MTEEEIKQYQGILEEIEYYHEEIKKCREVDNNDFHLVVIGLKTYANSVRLQSFKYEEIQKIFKSETSNFIEAVIYRLLKRKAELEKEFKEMVK